MNTNSCDINDKEKSCCSTQVENEKVDFSKHWNNVYSNSPEEKLGWFETDLSPTLNLISKTDLKKSARILNVGSGSTTLIDELIGAGYTNLIATDLSSIALQKLENRIGEKKIDCIVDDLTQPTVLKKIPPVDLWVDRAVLHFFIEKKDQATYFELLNTCIPQGGFVLLAEFSLTSATTCSGLPVHRYSEKMLAEKLVNFELIESFEHTYTMPSGAERPYIYTLFKKVKP
ncbi:MAG: class I SAM-dependent methyltransferase [Cyclobacteriaceae bacterium]|nr:class I SAM-dependent methyltransferase [Cyclobacteriaceae bacterium]